YPARAGGAISVAIADSEHGAQPDVPNVDKDMTDTQHPTDPMDAYSAAVVHVAETVLPSVASLRVRTRRGEGAGSASVLTADGFLLTSAHVVEHATAAEAAFSDGREVRADVIGRDPLSDLAVLRARDE